MQHLLFFFKVIPKYISNVKWDNQGAICFSFHLAGQYTSAVLLTGLILTQNSSVCSGLSGSWPV